MASLISTSERTGITAAFTDIFDTFKREIVVHKEPIKVVVDLNEDMFFGYDLPTETKPSNYSYTPVSGSFDAMISWTPLESEPSPEINSSFPDGAVRIKVRQDAYSYIESGKTEKITFDSGNFNVKSEPAVARFLDSTFYVYYLQPIK